MTHVSLDMWIKERLSPGFYKALFDSVLLAKVSPFWTPSCEQNRVKTKLCKKLGDSLPLIHMSKETCVVSGGYLLWEKCTTSAECKTIRIVVSPVMDNAWWYHTRGRFSQKNCWIGLDGLSSWIWLLVGKWTGLFTSYCKKTWLLM